ncbi:MAG: NAD(P)/FAD-dependent oxidoreductase [Myxococcota bacterium]|nr:NAD(P)/FAD-dependent oxidoreductase [Myxococcota bacterium]
MSAEYFDVVIVGGGLSGIGAACHLERNCPGKTYTILEGRDSIGGTWDLFRYPGVRSDSDMHTLGYSFKPWTEAKAIADGPSILKYIKQTATDYDVEKHIRLQHRVESASWSEADSHWEVTARKGEGGESVQVRGRYILMCAGYYNYTEGFTPEFEGRDDFQGEIIHPQHWPEDVDYTDKRIVVIGSGATAMTLVPSLSDKAAHVVMLQRSPTYVASAPDVDVIANFLRKVLPERWAYSVTRWKNINMQQFLYRRTRTSPAKVRKALLERTQKALGEEYDIDPHFTPRYDPWDQRLCLIPNGDLFEAIRKDRVSVVTEKLDRFTEDGILLANGEEIEADIIVTATGLNLSVFGDVQFYSDGKRIDVSKSVSYKGLMCTELPNVVCTFGYINASWTLRSDLIAEYFCRLIRYMDEKGVKRVVPKISEEERSASTHPWIQDFSAGYIERGIDLYPRQGSRAPWINPQDYKRDRVMFMQSSLEDGVLEFGGGETATGVGEDKLPPYEAAG